MSKSVKLITISIILLAIIAFAIFGFIRSDWMAIDTCMDQGGCWDYSAKLCRLDELNAQELCRISTSK